MGFIPTGFLLTEALTPSESSMISGLVPVVFVVDADGVADESLSALIRSAGCHPEAFTSDEEFLAHSLEPVSSCLILHVSDPGVGLELQRRFAAQRPHIPIIFLSSKFDVSATVQAVKAGAVEFLTYPLQAEDLLGAIREALERSRLSADFAVDQRLLRKSYGLLSHREMQVMALIGSGLLNKQIAGELGITEATVKAHRSQVMQKMKAISYPDLVRMAAKLGLTIGRQTPAQTRDMDRGGNLANCLLTSCALAP
jgi:FixJ family two-component response regulator